MRVCVIRGCAIHATISRGGISTYLVRRVPVLALTAGMHGDEINGMEIVRRIIDAGYNRVLRGTDSDHKSSGAGAMSGHETKLRFWPMSSQLT